MQSTEAVNEIEEGHLLGNFTINSLNERPLINLADGTSINHACETTEDFPHANTVQGYLADQFGF